MQQDYFFDLPRPQADKLPPELKEIIIYQGHARLAKMMPIKEILKHCLLRSDNSYINNRMNNIIKKDPEYLSSAVERMKIGDFRQFVKDMVMGEQENIIDSLHNLREDGDEKTYQSAILGWAKFGFGTEQKLDIDVSVSQKKELVKAISDDYRYSMMADEASYEMINEEEREQKALIDHYEDSHTMEFQGDMDDMPEETFEKVEAPKKRGRKKKEFPME